MKRPSNPPPQFRPQDHNLNKIQRRDQEVAEQKRALIEKMKHAGVKPKAEKPVEVVVKPEGRDVPPSETILSAIRSLPLILADRIDVRSTPRNPVPDLVEGLFRVQRTNRSEAILCWPYAPPNIAIVHALAVQALLTVPDSKGADGQGAAHEPGALRTLFYPWVRPSRLAQSSVLVDKNWVLKTNLHHINRGRSAEHSHSSPLSDLHRALIRVKDLDGTVKGRRGRPQAKLAEYSHPTLTELSPQAVLMDGSVSSHGLLHRTRRFTQLPDLSLGSPDNPQTAHYMMLALHRTARPNKALIKTMGPLHGVLIDATSRATRGLGDAWKEKYADVLATVRRLFGRVPVLAVTDDPFTHTVFARDLLAAHDARPDLPKKGQVPIAQPALYCEQGSIVAATAAAPISFEGCEHIRAVGFGGIGREVLDGLNGLHQRALMIDDDQSARLLRLLKSVIRRCANAPGGLQFLDDFVTESDGIETAIQVMAGYRPQHIFTELENPALALAQGYPEEIKSLRQKIEEFLSQYNTTTPMGSVLESVVGDLMGKSSKVLLTMRDGTALDFARDRLLASPIGERFKKRLDQEMLIAMDYPSTEALLREGGGSDPRTFRNHIGWLVLVGPKRADATRLMALPWLPRDVFVVGDLDLLKNIASDSKRLSRFTAFGVPVQKRLSRLAQEGADEIARRDASRTALTWDEPPEEDVEFIPMSSVVDLGTKGSPQIIVFKTSNNYTINARPGSDLVLCDWDDPANPFQRGRADEINVGDEIAVLGDAFIEGARGLLDIRATAAAGLRSYHETVRDALPSVPGKTRRDKAVEIAKRMGEPGLVDRVYNWINVDKYLQEDLRLVRPNAPQRLPEFLKFMTAIGRGERAAQIDWTWAVVATRSRRVSAALQFHEAYLGILVDPHARLAENPRIADGLRSLRRLAEDFVGRVEKKSVFKSEDAAA
ncbi:MAG: hypothetical protein ISP49_03065 [Reyranella sp.]|nr:hypothetical protein [Reyranella sp.]